MSNSTPHTLDDRIRALREELRIAESLNLGTVSRSALVLNQERIRGGLADSLRLIEELRQRIEDLENRS